MKIRRYIGNSKHEAILKVKMDLGNEAVILNTRKIKQKGIFKIFAKPLFEVLAAIDDDPKKPEVVETKIISNNIDEKENNKQNTTEKVTQEDAEKTNRIENIETKINDLEGMLKKIYSEVSSGGTVPKSQSKVMELFNNTLLKNEVEPLIVEKIIGEIKQKHGEDANMNEVAASIYGYIVNLMGKAQPITLKPSEKKHKVIFIGPTGVGKTTTIAKIAADFVLNKKKSIGLITADTYRIAAVDQLKTYAEILNIPVSVIYSPTEIKGAIDAFADKDVILIDTAGRSHRKKNQIDELKMVVEFAESDEVFLVISANTRVKDYKEIIETYGFIPNYKLIVTKIDETNSVGNILNLKYLSDRPLSYITTGQSVPDDIEILNIEKITKCMMGSMRYDGSS